MTSEIRNRDESIRFPGRGKKETLSPEEEEIVFKAFDERMLEIRSTLEKKGHLELVSNPDFRDARTKLIGMVGKEKADLHLEHRLATFLQN